MARTRSSSRARASDDESPVKSSLKKTPSTKKSTSKPRPTNSSKRSTGAQTLEAESEDENSTTPKKRRAGSVKKDEKASTPAEKKKKTQVVEKVEKIAAASPRVAKSPTKASTAAVTKVSPLGADHDGTSRRKSFFQRLRAGLTLFAFFCLGIHLGHTVLIPVIFVVQFMMYMEMVDLSYSHLLEAEHIKDLPLFRTQNWYWFIVTTFYSYSRILDIYSNIHVPHYTFISAMLFFLGFVGFVVTLSSGMYRIQFANLAWTWLALLIFIIVETACTISVMFEGLIWLVLPAILIMTNDTWAYIWGVLFGRTSLIQLSAKKTWEGFIGALISTPIQGLLMCRYMVSHPILVCKQTQLLTFDHPQCDISPLYKLVPYQLPFTIPILGWNHILVSDMYYHVIALSIFASIIAPFGGFFASGFKRAYAIKDFGTLIPGHGGFVDRMDCQLVMGMFVYVYYYTFVDQASTNFVATSLDYLASRTQLQADDVLYLYNKLDAAGKVAFKKLL